VLVQEFCDCLGRVLDKLDVQNFPKKIWNCDERGLMFVTTGFQAVTDIGKKHIYECVCTERGTTTTV
jgi:hypothetical protein